MQPEALCVNSSRIGFKGHTETRARRGTPIFASFRFFCRLPYKAGMLQEETETEAGAAKINRQLSTNDQIPLQMSIQETLMRFRDPESLPVEKGPDSLANYRDERPLTESLWSQTPMVSGLLQCKKTSGCTATRSVVWPTRCSRGETCFSTTPLPV